MENRNYQIIGESLKYYSKEKNGDHFLFEDLCDESILIAIVADGVSQQPCDWFASQTCCQTIIANFKNNRQLEYVERIKESVIQTNEAINAIEDRCSRMSTTLTALVWQYVSNKCFIVNIGDSRVYRIRDEYLQQLTKDDAIIRKREVMTSAGRRLIDQSQLTNVLGMPTQSLKITIERIDFLINDLLILSTDGFYDARKSFNTDIVKLARASNLLAEFKEKFDNFSLLANDDMTAIVIKQI